MEVTFYKPSEKHRLCAWTARRAKRSVVPGSVMAAGAGLPHDVGQYVAEAALRLDHGFWGLIERGATFRSTGRRITEPGRALIRANRSRLDDVEKVANDHIGRWKAGQPTEAAAHLDAALAAWRHLRVGDGLVFRWPQPTGLIVAGAGTLAARAS